MAPEHALGRERELDDLRGAIAETLSGRGRLTPLVDEPGILDTDRGRARHIQLPEFPGRRA